MPEQQTQKSKDFTLVAIVALVMLGCSMFTAVVVEAKGAGVTSEAKLERFWRATEMA